MICHQVPEEAAINSGIAGRSAALCGAGRGLGFGCAQALVREGLHMFIVARRAEVLLSDASKPTADNAHPKSATVQFVASDSAMAKGCTAMFAERQDFDVVFTNAGGLTPGRLAAGRGYKGML